jgi:nicotinamidase-related amidase
MPSSSTLPPPLVIIDMQRDFLEPGGFGAALNNDVALLRAAIDPTGRVLSACRAAGVMVVHTREGHRVDLSDLAPAKRARGNLATGIGDPGPMGRILVRGEAGHDIIPELAPVHGEPVVDKPGKGAFYATDLEAMLRGRGINQLLVCGVTTENLRQHHRARGQRPRLRLPRAGGLHRLLLPRIPGCRDRDDQGARRHLRLGRAAGRAVGRLRMNRRSRS